MRCSRARRLGLALFGLVAIALAAPARAQWLHAPPGNGSGGVNSARARTSPYVILVSFDGFRHDFLERGLTPRLAALAAAGARAEALVPVFPTKTFVNHYTIATGMYPEHHRLATNNFWDDSLQVFYRGSNPVSARDARFYGGEPIWVTAERQGMVAASIMWVGGEAAVGGVLPSLYWPFDATLARRAGDRDKLEAVRVWLALPDSLRPHLIAAYFTVPDDSAHWFADTSAVMQRAIARADSVVGQLQAVIDSSPVRGQVNLVVVSDHGVTEARRWLWLEDYAELGDVLIYGGPVAHIWFRGDTARVERVYATLRQKLPAYARVYRPRDLPASWHYANLPRGGDLIVVAEPGWQVSNGRGGNEQAPYSHGYAPFPDMYGIFLAAGPGIRAGVRLPAFENVHVYPLVAALLGLTPNPAADGRLEVTRPILK